MIPNILILKSTPTISILITNTYTKITPQSSTQIITPNQPPQKISISTKTIPNTILITHQIKLTKTKSILNQKFTTT